MKRQQEPSVSKPWSKIEQTAHHQCLTVSNTPISLSCVNNAVTFFLFRPSLAAISSRNPPRKPNLQPLSTKPNPILTHHSLTYKTVQSAAPSH